MHILRFKKNIHHGRKTYPSISSVIFVSALPLCDSEKNQKMGNNSIEKRQSNAPFYVGACLS